MSEFLNVSMERYQFKCDVQILEMTFVGDETWRKHMEEKHGKEKE